LNAAFGWVLALLAVVVGQVAYGWRGVLLALTAVAFWLLLQFSQALRVMRNAALRPVGAVDSAVMLQSRLHAGQTLAQILKHTRSLGHKRSDVPETYAWQDVGGDEVVVEMHNGRLAKWQLERAEPAQGGSVPGA